MSESSKILLGSILRHGLTVFGAWLASRGVIDAQDVSSYAEAIVGGLIVVVTVITSYTAKKSAIESPSRTIS